MTQADWSEQVSEILLTFAKRIEKMPPGKTYGWEEELAKVKAATLDAMPEKDNRLFLKDHAESYAKGLNAAIDTMIKRLG